MSNLSLCVRQFFILVTRRQYQRGGKSQNGWVWGISHMAWELLESVWSLGTWCLTRKDAVGIALHAVHSSPLPTNCFSPLGEVWGVGIRSFLFSCSPHETYGKGKSSSGSAWHLQPHIPLTVCQSNLLAVPQLSPDPGNGSSKEPGFWEPAPSCPQDSPSASSCPLQHPHTWTWSLTTLLGLWLRLCRVWMSSKLSQPLFLH